MFLLWSLRRRIRRPTRRYYNNCSSAAQPRHLRHNSPRRRVRSAHDRCCPCQRGSRAAQSRRSARPPPGALQEQCALMQTVMAEDRPSVGLTVIVLKTADQKSRLMQSGSADRARIDRIGRADSALRVGLPHCRRRERDFGYCFTRSYANSAMRGAWSLWPAPHHSSKMPISNEITAFSQALGTKM